MKNLRSNIKPWQLFRRLKVFTLILALILNWSLATSIVQAASLTSVSDVMTTIKASTASSHDISFTLGASTALDASETVAIDFGEDDSKFTVAGAASATGDFGFNDGAERTIVGVDGDCTGHANTNDIAVSANDTTGVVTFTACGSFTASAANATINVEYGTAAGGTNRVTNPAAGTYTVSITAASDTGSYAVAVISNDIVNITATVDPTITFSVSDNAIGFGTLSTSAARFATGDANGSSSDSSAAFTMTIAVNTGKGYTISYNGATLTSSGNTVTVADITNDADGTSGSEQFGMGFSTDGAATIATGYDHNATAGNRDWKFVASTTTTIASETTEAGSETISAFLLTNIATATEPGSYTTNVTFVASGVY